jgi:serine/threonine-protein kinase
VATPPPSPSLIDLTEASACRYVPIELIGTGSMGTVYKVQDSGLNNEPVALKLLHKNLIPDPTYAARFRREVALARKLSHPHIVKIFDFGELKAGGYFFTMELISGTDVRHRLSASTQPIPISDALRIFFQTALALDYAHSQGIVHRDIKPENILLDDTNLQTKLSDFSSAKDIALDLGLTPEGSVLGTPAYMAPELLRSEVTPKVDIYSLGIVLFEMLTGRAPFEGDTLGSIISKHMKDPIPSVAIFRPDAPSWCQEVIETCTEKNPNDRYSSIDEMIYEFTEYAFRSGLSIASPSLPYSIIELAQESRRSGKGLFGFLKSFSAS